MSSRRGLRLNRPTVPITSETPSKREMAEILAKRHAFSLGPNYWVNQYMTWRKAELAHLFAQVSK